ncbi:MAG: hypothetical protein ACYC46_01335 [Acidobacteriaceae bacterium]
MYEQASIPVVDEKVFDQVKHAIESAFASATVQAFLDSVERAKLRIRDFEQILQRGLLGSDVPSAYGKLGDSDQGQIRELYLRSLEQVAPLLREKYLKLYAYY